MNIKSASIPMQIIGPVKIVGSEVNDEIQVPLATYETPLWPSTERGMRVVRECNGIFVEIIDDRMTRSVVFEAENVAQAHEVMKALQMRKNEVSELVSTTSRFAKLLDLHFQIVGRLLYIRFEMTTGDASGHNMVTKAADQLMQWILQEYLFLKYISVSANYCTDKKVSAVNGILGRGKYVVAEIVIPRDVCQSRLRTTPEKIIELNLKKNWMGSMLAGGVRSANAHFANILLALYLATGQDAANIVEGSQGFVYAEMQNDDLYFSVTLPNVIVGSIGNGKDLDFVKENLEMMGCLDARDVGVNARRLAIITAATVLCGELSLMAALTNPQELVRSHITLERHKKI